MGRVEPQKMATPIRSARGFTSSQNAVTCITDL